MKDVLVVKKLRPLKRKGAVDPVVSTKSFRHSFPQKVQFWVIPISLGVLDIVKAGAQRLELVRYTWGLYDPGPGTGSGEEKLYQSKVHINSLVQDYSKQKQILQHKYSKQSFQQTID